MSHIIALIALFNLLPYFNLIAAQSGQWKLLQKSIGISAMHMQLLNDDSVIIYDRTEFGPSNLSLTEDQCSRAKLLDCTAHAAVYNSITNTFRPLTVLTNNWCSSGSTLPNGTLLQTGGYWTGDRAVRMFRPSCNGCDWVEFPNKLLHRRWYATNHALPDGRAIIVGGTRAFNYEFYPRTTSSSPQLFQLDFLIQTKDPEENNLYPFVFLDADGNLFIFANNRAILFDYIRDVVVRTYPAIPGGDPRSYPSTGSAVALPLKDLDWGVNIEVEVLICGGAPAGSFLKALHQRRFLPALNTCARMKFTDPKPTWSMETMPMARVMSDMLLLPNGDVLIINGAGKGSAGWELGRDPVLSPVIYHPNNARGSRFEVQTPSRIPRMYHSCAILLRDGRVLVGGGNPHAFYNFTNVLYPTELSLEAFSPPYLLDPINTRLRPIISEPISNFNINLGKHLTVKFLISGQLLINPILLKVTLLRPPFNTHSTSMSQRMLVLTITSLPWPIGLGQFQVDVAMPKSTSIAPPGYYMLFVVHQNVPSEGVWVQLT